MDSRTNANLKTLDTLFRQIFKDKPNDFFPNRYGVFLACNGKHVTPAISTEFTDEEQLRVFNDAIFKIGFTSSSSGRKKKMITKGEDNIFYVGLVISSLGEIKNVSGEIRKKFVMLSTEKFHIDVDVHTLAYLMQHSQSYQLMSTQKYLSSSQENAFEKSEQLTTATIPVIALTSVTTQTVFQQPADRKKELTDSSSSSSAFASHDESDNKQKMQQGLGESW